MGRELGGWLCPPQLLLAGWLGHPPSPPLSPCCSCWVVMHVWWPGTDADLDKLKKQVHALIVKSGNAQLLQKQAQQVAAPQPPPLKAPAGDQRGGAPRDVEANSRLPVHQHRHSLSGPPHNVEEGVSVPKRPATSSGGGMFGNGSNGSGGGKGGQAFSNTLPSSRLGPGEGTPRDASGKKWEPVYDMTLPKTINERRARAAYGDYARVIAYHAQKAKEDERERLAREEEKKNERKAVLEMQLKEREEERARQRQQQREEEERVRREAARFKAELEEEEARKQRHMAETREFFSEQVAEVQERKQIEKQEREEHNRKLVQQATAQLRRAEQLRRAQREKEIRYANKVREENLQRLQEKKQEALTERENNKRMMKEYEELVNKREQDRLDDMNARQARIKAKLAYGERTFAIIQGKEKEEEEKAQRYREEHEAKTVAREAAREEARRQAEEQRLRQLTLQVQEKKAKKDQERMESVAEAERVRREVEEEKARQQQRKMDERRRLAQYNLQLQEQRREEAKRRFEDAEGHMNDFERILNKEMLEKAPPSLPPPTDRGDWRLMLPI
eukprot:jgi/Mesvir1/21589/Mv04024-RA.2